MDTQVSKECLQKAKDKMNNAIIFLEDELKSFRAGKANPAVFNGLVVDYYGTPTPIPQVSSVTTPDAKTMLIQPWDKKLIPAIEKAIMDANLGFTPQNNGEQIRISVPPLTEERRKELEDVCKDAENEIQKETDNFNKRIDGIIAAKEKEIMTV